MTNERKAELFDEILGWVVEVINDEEELKEWGKNMGFADSELMEEFN